MFPGKAYAPNQHLLEYDSISHLLFSDSSWATNFAGDWHVLLMLVPVWRLNHDWWNCSRLFHLPTFLPHLLQSHLPALWENKIEIGAKTKRSFAFTELITVLMGKVIQMISGLLFISWFKGMCSRQWCWLEIGKGWLNVTLFWMLLYDLLKCSW